MIVEMRQSASLHKSNWDSDNELVDCTWTAYARPVEDPWPLLLLMEVEVGRLARLGTTSPNFEAKDRVRLTLRLTLRLTAVAADNMLPGVLHDLVLPQLSEPPSSAVHPDASILRRSYSSKFKSH